MVNSGTFFSFENACKVWILVVCVLRLANGQYKPTSECNCGYGGLCVRNETGHLQEPPCTVCRDVSIGLYAPDCHSIINYCKFPGLCMNGGKCVPIFGSFFCRCPSGFTGQTCHLRVSEYGKEFEEYGISNEYYVYYQVQTLPNGEKTPFFIIYDPGDQKELQKRKERGIKVIVNVEDGRSLYPMKRFGDFVRKDYHQMCLEDAENNPQLWDQEVCRYVPKGELWGFEVKSKVYQVPTDISDARSVYYKPDKKAGFWVQLTFQVVWIDELNARDDVILFVGSFRIFRYLFSKVKNNCVTSIDFDGCSKDKKRPDIYLRGHPILVSTVIKENGVSRCRGIKYPEQYWYLMRGKSVEGTYDTVPRLVDGSEQGPEDHKHIHFPPRAFSDGVQMITVELFAQGDPPHYGGQSTYPVYGRCWLKIVLGPLNVQPVGGSVVTASCYTSLKLDLISLNPGISVIEMIYRYKCNLTDDVECEKEKITDVPAIRKFVPRCGLTVQFDLTASHEQVENLTQKLVIIVHFSRSNVQLRLDCLYNCFPIDPVERTVVVATTTPYRSGRIDWNVTYRGIQIDRVERQVDTFYPLVSTRILRFDGIYIQSNGSTTTPVSISSRLFSEGIAAPLDVAVAAKSSNLGEITNKFTFKPLSTLSFTGFIFERPSDPIHHEFEPLTYSLVQVNDEFQDSLVIGFSFYDDTLLYLSNWPKVRLCIRDAMDIDNCSRDYEPSPMVFPVGLNNLQTLFLKKDINQFTTFAVFWFTQGLVWNQINPTNKSWAYTVKDRATVLGWMRKVQFEDLREHHARAILSILAMSFYTLEGNRLENLINFFEEFVEYRRARKNVWVGEVDFHRWLKLRELAIELLYDVMMWTKDLVETSGGQFKFVSYVYGDVLDGLVRCMNLANIQSSFVLRFKDDIVFSIYKDLMVAEQEISRDSYQGILCAFNRSRKQEVDERLDKHVNFIFERYGDDESDAWMDFTNLELPKEKELPSLLDKELRFSVYVIGNWVSEHSISPTLYIDMRNAEGERFESLPDGRNYTVIFPVTIDGKLVNVSSRGLWSDVIITPSNPADENKYFSVYKIVFPNAFEIWELRIFTDEAVPIKTAVNLENLPQIDDVDKKPARTGVLHSSGKYLIEVVIQASDFSERFCGATGKCRDILPLHFYFGMLLTNSTPVETPIMFSVKDTVEVCDVREPTFTKNTAPCHGIEKGEFNTIDCECGLFGFVVATVKHVRINRVFAVDIGLVIPTTIAPVQIIVPVFITCFIVLVLGYALWLDWRRSRMDALIYLDDCHPLDKYVYVLGIYTGSSIMAGTRATVALKIIGLNSSSRVHLLQSAGRTILRPATDDWFVITTKQPLGKIASVAIWHNHQCLSDWYCDHILIFDVKQDNWYFVNAERWFKIYPHIEDSQMAQLKAFKFGNMENALKEMPHQFRTNYIVETRNTHHFFSLFFLHLRSLTSNEHRACIFLIKFFAMWFWVWFVEDVEYGNQLRSVDEPNIDEIYINADVGIKISQVVLLSYLFTTPYYLIIRSTQMSGLIQKKTTNRINIEAIHQENKTIRSEQEEKALKGKRAEHEEKASKENRREQAESQSKSVLFQLESVDRMESGQSWIVRPGEDEHGRHQRSAPKKHWSATHYEMPRWKKFVIMAFGPSQFRCVNVRHQLYEVKMARRLLLARVLAGLMIASAVVLSITVEELTSYWRKSKVSVFLFAVSFITDILIINPILILINSLIFFLLLKTSNQEFMFWSENTPISEVEPETFEGYIEVATGKEYKPLNSSEIRRYEHIQLVYSSLRMVLVYAYLVLCVYVITRILTNRFDIGYHHTVRSILAATTVKSKYEIRPTLTLDEIVNVEKVKYFLPSEFADLKFIWPNGQPISKDKGRWFLDLASKPLGPASIMVTCISDKVTMRIPKYFVPYYDIALGFIDESEVLKTPIVLADREIYYSPETFHRINGASDEGYDFSGHRATLPMTNWIDYYVTMVTYIEDVIVKPELIPRVMILTMNTVNAFTQRVTTCDVVIEILPSGVTSARLEIDSVKAFTPTRNWVIFMRLLLVFLTLCFTWLTVVDVSKVGFKVFVDSWYGTMKIALLVVGTLVTFSTFSFFVSKFTELNKFADYPNDKYKDIHHVHWRETVDSMLLAIFLFTMVADVAVAIREAFGNRIRVLSQASTQGTRLAFAMLLTILLLSGAVDSSLKLYGLKRWYFFIVFYSKTMFPLSVETRIAQFYIMCTLVIFIVTTRFCTALFIFKFEECETFFRMKRTKPYQVQSVAILKYTDYRKHTWTDEELLILFERRSISSPKSKTPSPETKPVQLAPNLDSRISKLSQRFFGFGWSDSPEPKYRQSPKRSKDQDPEETQSKKNSKNSRQ